SAKTAETRRIGAGHELRSDTGGRAGPHLAELAGAHESDDAFAALVEHDILPARRAVRFEAKVAGARHARRHEMKATALKRQAPPWQDRRVAYGLVAERRFERGDARVHV